MYLRMDELRELITRLTSVKASTPFASSSPSDNSSEKVNMENIEEDEGSGEGKEGDEKDKGTSLRKLHPPMGKVERRSSIRFLHATLPIHRPSTLI